MLVETSGILFLGALMSAKYDVLILGGGCSGLALASRLAEFGRNCPRTLVLEKRKEYSNDRTWCFWDDGDPGSQKLAQHQWQKMRIATADKSVEVLCGSSPYLMVAAIDYYKHTISQMKACAKIDFRTDVDLPRRLIRENGQWLSGTDRADVVIDTRPRRAPKPGESTMWQSFYGVEIETEEEVFDPCCLDLMDFSSSTASRILFTYFLPTSTRRALIEVTHFGPEPEYSISLQKDLDSAIKCRLGKAKYREVRREEGILPMGMHSSPAVPDPSYIHAGLASGAARPCTGYAFQRIQRWAKLCAQSIVDSGLPTAHAPDPIWQKSMDHLFLSVLKSRPDLAPSLFLALFEKTKTDRIIRFLSDSGQLGDYLDVVSALPMLPFLKEIPGAFRSKAIEWQESWAS